MKNLSIAMPFEQKVINFLNKKPQKILYTGLVPKVFRKKLENKIYSKYEERVSQWWNVTIKAYFEEKNIPHFSIKAKKDLGTDKIIWQYWGQGISNNIPNIVKLSFYSVDKYKGDYKVIRLDDNNLEEYVDIPDFIKEKKIKGKIAPAFFSDILRVLLLATYGGIWIDATILLTSEIDKEILESEFFIFSRDYSISIENRKKWEKWSYYFNWSDKHNVNHLNSFMLAKKGNELINDMSTLLLYFWYKQESSEYYFFFQVMLNRLLKYKSYDYLTIDDTLPHLLQYKLLDKYDEIEYKKILSKINIHKLKHRIKEKDVHKDSFYSYLINHFK